VHTSANQDTSYCRDTERRSGSVIGIRIWIRDSDRYQKLTICSLGPLPTFPENFMQIGSEVFAQSC